MSEKIHTCENDRSPGLYRASVRSLYPAFSLRARDEGRFMVRVLAISICCALAGGFIGLLPDWSSRFWLEGALLGLAAGLGATLVCDTRAWRRLLTLAGLSGIGLCALAVLGHPLAGIAWLGAGIGWVMAISVHDAYTKLNVILAAALGSMLGAWAGASLAGTFAGLLPLALTMALRWSIMGLFISLGALPMHLVMRKDPVLAYARKVRRALKPAYRVCLDQALDQYIACIRAKRPARDFDEYFERKARAEEVLLVAAESGLDCRQAYAEMK